MLVRSLQIKIGSFLYFRLLNGMCSVINLYFTIATQKLLDFPKTRSSFSHRAKNSKIQYNYHFYILWERQVLIVAYIECNHEWSGPGEMNHPTKWTGNWWLKSEIKVKFHNYQSHLCCLSLIGGVQQEDKGTWGAGSAALSNVYTPEKFLSLVFAVSRLPTVNLSVFPKSSERSSINCLTTCTLFVMFL